MTNGEPGASEILHRLKIPIIIIVVVFVAAMLARVTAIAGSRRYSGHFIKAIKGLVLHSKQWHTTGAQDKNPLMSLVHANYALAYLHVVRRLGVDDRDIHRMTGIDIQELQYFLEEDQQKALRKISDLNPQLKVDGPYNTI